MQGLKRLFFISLLGLFVSGCVTKPDTGRFITHIDSISGNTSGESRYILLPANDQIDESDLQFQEYAQYTNRLLANNGFTKVGSIDESDIVIFMDYGIGEPEQNQYSYSVPTWGQTGVSSSYTTGTYSSFGGFGSYSGNTTYTPTYGVTGSTTHVGTFTTYFRYVVLDALSTSKLRNNEKGAQIWKTKVTSTGSSGDLRRVFPILITAMNGYVATNTGKKVKLEIQEDSPEVSTIKGIIPENSEGSDKK